MGCMQAQQRDFDDSVAGFSKRMAKSSQTVLRTRPIPTRPSLTKEGWKLRTLRKLRQLANSADTCSAWAGPLSCALDTWNTDEDIRWRENLKFYYLHSPAWGQSPRSSMDVKSDKKSMWVMPGLTSENIFKVSSHMEFLDNQLHCCETHGVAFMIRVFIETFVGIYRAEKLNQEGLSERMKRDVKSFSTIAQEALELYYEPIDIVALFKKSKKYLGFLIREVVLEDTDLHSLFLTSVKFSRAHTDALLSQQYFLCRDCDLQDVNRSAKPMLVGIARADPGFSACVLIVRHIAEIPRMKDQVQAIYDLSQSMSAAISYTAGEDAKVELDPDDLMTLCAYFLLRAGAEDVGAAIELLTSLVPTDVMADATSYTLATLESALEYIAQRTSGLNSS